MTIEKAAKKAAEIWANWYRLSLAGNNGAHDRASMMTQAFVAATAQPPSEDKVKIFQDKLEELILEEFAGKPPPPGPRIYGPDMVQLWVDYHPEGHLATALQAAGVTNQMSALPWKTGMRISDKAIETKEGYSAQWKDYSLE